ncbi:MAG: MerC domain-containing protein [Kordiimonadaceae bacterium]|nr:MerC domain-containing protein [Kordiimonadaceae bacterium]MBO6567271.1 MerC domain-containing protein [Kordiimonadaceae bacterium]MBO6963515.1 MerC domain-containing protein [Kordiimonadaceae bacterium]
MNALTAYRTGLDRCGMVAAAVCLTHCALLPFAVFAAPVLGSFAPDTEWLHMPLVLFAVALGGYAMVVGNSRHRQKAPAAIAALGMMLLMASLAEAQLGELAEFFAIIGAPIMAVAHVKNLRAACECCPCSQQT